MYIDYAKIKVKAGNGGDGSISFHREKYVTKGGPDGGDGGNGGNVILETDSNIRTLYDFRIKKKYYAGDGQNGSSRNRRGLRGDDIVIKVPAGTIVRDADSGKVIVDMFSADMRHVLLRGGRGGKGNAGFATPTRQSPGFAHPGDKTEEHVVILELKTIADVGLVGFPNVGKSTILSVVSAAKPEIANYHFTTLTPNLGVVAYDDKTFVMADIPGLIEGASSGAGLGHDFLKHIERTRLIVHVVDISGSEGRDPVEDFEIINNELRTYSSKLAKCRQIVAANKCDIVPDGDNLARFKKRYGEKYEIFPVSAATREGFAAMLGRITEILSALPEAEPEEPQIELERQEIDESQWNVSRDFDGMALVSGPYIEQLLGRINFEDFESSRYFHKTLRRLGIIEALRKMGVKDGDSVRVIDIEFDFVE